VKYVLIGLLKTYRLVVSPLYGNVCRYYPSCSAYALRSVQVHGAVKGSWLAGRRLLRCHPWTPGGYDPVPGTPEWQEEQALLAVPDRGHAGHDHSPADPQPRDPRNAYPTDPSPVLQRLP
jgi:putative membrane protein insertion efficiency factor